MRYYRRAPERRKKADGTWVTAADNAVETEIRTRIRNDFPEHNVLGEEEGLRSASGGPPAAEAPVWIVDPIDGTNNFMSDIPIWATLVGLQVGGRAVLGVVHAPALGETYDAARGLGARCNGEPIEVAPVSSLEDATALFPGPEDFTEFGLKDFFDRLVSRCWRTRGFGDFWGHMLVARGAAHVMVEPELAPWDVVPLIPIVTEAGGAITHLDGTDITEGGSCLTTSGSIHDEVLELVGGTASG